MRKILLVLVFALAATSTMAQSLVRYHGEVNIGGSFGVIGAPVNFVNFHTIQGVNITDYASVGVGFGLDMHNEFREFNGSSYGFSSKETDLLFPLFLNAKGYLPLTKKIKTYLSVDFGGKFGLTEQAKGYQPIFVAPAVGVLLNNFLFQIGFSIEDDLGLLGGGYSGVGAVQLKFGWSF
jgi:hypothetical protein